MLRGGGRKDSARRYWAAVGCAAAMAMAWVGLERGGTMPNLSAGHHALVPQPVEAAAIPGAAQYGQYCAVCHQANGQGTPGVFPPLAGSPVVTGDAHYLARVVLYGLQGRIVVGGKPYSGAMPGVAKNINDAQIAQVLTYIRSSWGNNAPPVSDDIVQAERAVPGTPQDNGAKFPP